MPPQTQADKQNPSPVCGRRRPGRPRAAVPVPNVLDALSEGKTVTETARLLRMCDLAHKMGRRALGLGDTSE